MVSCDICGKEFKNTQGLRGHKNFVHADTVGGFGQPVTQQAAQQPLSSDSGTRVTTEQRLSQLESRFARLEHITGVRETDELEKLLGITDTSLTERVAQLTEQLSKLTEQLKSEYVSRETMETIAAELSGESESFHKEIANTYNMSAIAIRESHESCENSFSKIKGQSTATANELYELSKSVKHIQESVQANHASINQLNAKLVSLEHTSSELENKVARVKNLTRRAPTGEIVGIQLNNKRERHFREYRTSEGLARPYRTKRDLILGNRWVDLAEPED
jgi:chromosome segregation ATPase